jgi:hypothetical protein
MLSQALPQICCAIRMALKPNRHSSCYPRPQRRHIALILLVNRFAPQVPWSHYRGGGPSARVGVASEAAAVEAMCADAMRMTQRYVGHCNMRTDIKEAVFVGREDAVVACGSDHGHVLLFDAATGELLRLLWADSEVANCVQCHPTLPVLATSGLDDAVRSCP